ncbi:MAG TPA: PSD1 and planctomycete cytochrome C domain-containing protein [Tepidisphaeraceae bacterium]|nr:PSD1 and planctomycete cytochrome C domain-containing protein [Tepidisphaeraceae bacterium]
MFHATHRRLAPVAILLSFCASALSDAPTTQPLVDFARDVQPILSDNCYFCHGPDAGHRKADLRLDILDPKEGPTAKRDGYAILVPGSPAESEMILRLINEDEAEKMPPPKSNRKLTPKQIDTIKLWVEQGAQWGKHWSLVAPVRPHQPVVKDTTWPRNAMDRFILARLERDGLKPSPEADKPTLIRRVTLDLTGLPPTPEEVDAFVADASPDAYEKVVDRLLASPRYGEHMVWNWLDAARYADTNGYQNDPIRTMWPWRDWVIRAMNENLPFDQFLTWQLAGDLIPSATQDQRLASAFNRNHPFNGEGGRIPEETRVENVMDRAETTATTFLGLTVGCARCHDHKFDPISHKEYFSFYAYFNQSEETGEQRYIQGGNVAPVMSVMSDAEQRNLAFHQKNATDAQEKLAAKLPEIDAKQAEWEKSVAPGAWKVVTPASVSSTAGATVTTQPDGAVLLSGESPDNDIHELVLKTDLAKVTGLRLDALQDDSLPNNGPGRAPDAGNFALTYIEATSVGISNPLDKRPLGFAGADATFSQPKFDVGGATEPDPRTGWAVYKAPDPSKLTAVFKFAGDVAGGSDRELRLRLHYASEHKQHTLGKFRLSLTDGQVLPPAVGEAMAVPADQRSDEQKKQVRDYYRTRVSPEFKALNEAVNEAQQRVTEFENSLTKVMVMNDAKPRETFVLDKGAYNSPTDQKVEPGVLAVLNPLPPDAPKNRLTLAKWMVDEQNPLTARVTVNRYWQQFFGTGIVKTSEDFGVQGEHPVHPELLDWLAVEFRERGWDVKAMHRLIVTSAAYRQSSKVTPEAFERDPENRLIARGPRFRLPAVVIRDQALAASGLLVEKIGGPPVKPYQPPGIWEEATFGQIKYEQDHGDALYRRGAYVFWRRIVGPTGFFDASSRTVCTVKPNRTNTPLHALTTLNDVTYVEAARALAERAMHKCEDHSPDKLVATAYRYVTGRTPGEKERGVLVSALARLKSQYANDKDAAAKLLSVGERKRDEKLDPVEHAALTGVCLAILNLDEVLNNE